MLYNSGSEWREAKHKRVSLVGMSGVGKTYLANALRKSGNWFHFSVDYRIGTKYLGEFIVDNFKKEAMKNQLLKKHFLDDSIYLASNISFHNLAPLSTYLGKPGKITLGGIPFREYLRRQRQHFHAEVSASKDIKIFSKKSHDLYGYDHFIADTSGSICEIVDPTNPSDTVLKTISKYTLPVWIKGSERQTAELYKRFLQAPKPMYYKEKFLKKKWSEYLKENNQLPSQVDPDDFAQYGFKALIKHRLPLYEEIANKWGVIIDASSLSNIKNTAEFNKLIEIAIDNK